MCTSRGVLSTRHCWLQTQTEGQHNTQLAAGPVLSTVCPIHPQLASCLLAGVPVAGPHVVALAVAAHISRAQHLQMPITGATTHNRSQDDK